MEQPDLLIRPIQPEDNSKIAFIIRSVLTEFKANKPGTVYFDPTTDELFRLFRKEGSFYLVAELDGRVIGGAGVYPTEGLEAGWCELVKLYLVKEARGKGIGKRLIESCIEKAYELGYQVMYLETMPELRMALDLYKKCGFVQLPQPKGKSGHFGCDLWMARELDKA